MVEGVEDIGRKDIVWSYAATFFTMGAGLILLPFMLHKLPAETIGIWYIFQTITFLVTLLDMGFKSSFARNVSYIFSGIKHLQKEGIEKLETDEVDYSLLNGTLSAMRLFYRIMALVWLVLLSTAGTLYFYQLVGKYSGDKTDIIVAWIIMIIINCYNLYTLYYESLLTGKGYIKQIQQINILGQSIYLILAIILIYSGFGLTSIVASQLVSIIIRRILCSRTFFTKQMNQHLKNAGTQSRNEIFKTIFPNSIKTGLTDLGSFIVLKSPLFICSVFMPLSLVGVYAISLQVVDIIARCSIVYHTTQAPKLAQYRAERNIQMLKQKYIYSLYALVAAFAIGGLLFVLLGNPFMQLIKSNTQFLPASMLCTMLLFYLLEQNHTIAIGYIMADNKIPFYIPSLLSGVGSIVLTVLFLQVFDMGVWGLILAPGIAQLAYQNWRWPSLVIKELKDS